MARDFDGTDDNLRNANGVSGIDVDAFTMACLVSADGSGTFMMTASDVSAGNARAHLDTFTSGAGFRFRFRHPMVATARWDYATDLTFGTWYHLLITFDRSSASNDPRMWIDGSEVTLTEIATPTGAGSTGTDSIIFGENVGGGNDFDGRVAEAAIWDRIVSDDEAALLTGRNSPLVAPRGLKAYWPLVRDPNERMQGANLTASGSTVVPHPRVRYPARVLSSRSGLTRRRVGIGAGWAIRR